MHRLSTLVITVMVVLGSGLIGLPVALPQDAQPKLPPLVDSTTTKAVALNTPVGAKSTLTEAEALPVLRPGGQSGVLKAAPAVPVRGVLTPRRSHLLLALYVSHGALQMLDVASTLHAVGSGSGREGNPLLGRLVAHPPAFIAFKAATATAVIFGAHRLSKRHRLAAILLTSVMNGAYVYIVQHNFRSAARRR